MFQWYRLLQLFWIYNLYYSVVVDVIIIIIIISLGRVMYKL
jgi:hypothetical protein